MTINCRGNICYSQGEIYRQKQTIRQIPDKFSTEPATLLPAPYLEKKNQSNTEQTIREIPDKFSTEAATCQLTTMTINWKYVLLSGRNISTETDRYKTETDKYKKSQQRLLVFDKILLLLNNEKVKVCHGKVDACNYWDGMG